MLSAVSTGPVKRAQFTADTVGDNELVALVNGRKIRVLSLFLSVSVAGTVRFESGTSDNFLTGAMTMAVGTPLVLPENLTGWFETVAGEKLNLILTGTNQTCRGALTYQEI